MKDLHLEIKKILKRRGLSAKELTEKLEITESGFYAMLKNFSVKAITLEKIAEVLDVPVGYFFDETNTVNTNHGIQANGNGNISIRVNEQAKEIEHLKEQIKSCQELLKSKDEIIKLLKNK